MASKRIARIMARDLGTLGDEVRAYRSEEDLWRVVPGISNSAGTLVLHLTGNLRHFVGAVLGGTGYVRDREAEFSERDLDRAGLLARIEEAAADVAEALGGLDDATLESEYPHRMAGVTLGVGQFLVHLACHLAYHLGQVDYHRRILTGGESLPGVLSIPSLAAGLDLPPGSREPGGRS